MLKKILIALAALLLILIVLGFVLPRDFSVSRSVVIAAEPARVHEFVGELRRWPEWTPWAEHDPSVKTELGELTTGVGAFQKWTSDGGDGWLRFTKCDPATGIAYDMAFVNGGKEMPAKGSLAYRSVSGGTEVTWHMEGKMDVPVIGPFFALFADSMIGGEFDKGLSKLEICGESTPPPPG